MWCSANFGHCISANNYYGGSEERQGADQSELYVQRRDFFQILLNELGLIFFFSFYFQYLSGKAEQNLFSRSSSTSGTDSSIRIRKTRGAGGCTERKWFISVSLAMIFTVLVASAGIYFGCELIFGLCFYIVQKTNNFFVYVIKMLYKV